MQVEYFLIKNLYDLIKFQFQACFDKANAKWGRVLYNDDFSGLASGKYLFDIRRDTSSSNYLTSDNKFTYSCRTPQWTKCTTSDGDCAKLVIYGTKIEFEQHGCDHSHKILCEYELI